MAYSQASLALELYRPTVARYAPILIVFCLVGALWIAVDKSVDRSLIIHGSVQTLTDETAPKVMAPADTQTIKSGEVEVPAYFFPDAATGTDRYVPTRTTDCGGTS